MSGSETKYTDDDGSNCLKDSQYKKKYILYTYTLAWHYVGETENVFIGSI